jgi:acetylornithine aminotransferase
MLCKSHCDVFAPGTHASTFGGNPLACAAGNAVLDAFDDEALLDNVATRSEQLKRGLADIAARHGCIDEVRGWGLLLGIQLSEGCGFVAADLCKACLASGLLTVPAGVRVLRLVPPLVVSEGDVDEALNQLDAAIAKLSAAGA